LGLAIAKWAVEVQKGCIGVTEREGGGSRFYLRLQQHRDNLVTK
jgi:K+-sensing histidine kinase KdpD